MALDLDMLQQYTYDELLDLVVDMHEHNEQVNRTLSELVSSFVDSEKEVLDLLTRLFYYLDYTEANDDGKEFHPIGITCCRALMVDGLNETINGLKQYLTKNSIESHDTDTIRT